MEKLKKLWDTFIVCGIFALAGFELLCFFFGIVLTIAVAISLPITLVYYILWLMVKVLGIIISIF